MTQVKPTVEISAVWARREGNNLIVSVEIEGEWRVAFVEPAESNYSHIAEARGYYSAHGWPLDSIQARSE